MPEGNNTERVAEAAVPFCEWQTAASLRDIQPGLSEAWHLISVSQIDDALAAAERIEQRPDHLSPRLTNRYRATTRLLRLAVLTCEDDRLAVFVIAMSQVFVERGAGLDMLPAETWNRTDVLDPRDRRTPGSVKSAGNVATQAGGSIADAITPRERDVLAMVRQGYSNKRIARSLEISPETVKSHLKRIFSKLAVSTRSEAVSRAASLLTFGVGAIERDGQGVENGEP